MKREKELLHQIRGKRFEIFLYVDVKNKSIIETFISNSKILKKVQLIIQSIIEQKPRKEIYRRENYNESIRNVTAMKFLSSNNARIYCKDYVNEQQQRCIVLSEFLPKKQKDNLTNAERNLIDKVNKYDYS